MSKEYTKEQKQAFSLRHKNMLVAAGAGSGKTAVLVERIIRLVKDELVDIDRLLIVTFTNVAASEMRERIGEALENALNNNPNSDHLLRQITLLNKANITTIHSFCLNLIKNNFNILDLDPNFRIGDNTEIAILKEESLDYLFEKSYEENNIDDDFIALLESYSSNKDDIKLRELVLRLYNFSVSSPNPKEYLENLSRDFDLKDDFNFSDSKWAKTLEDFIRIEIKSCVNLCREALNIIDNEETLNPYKEAFLSDLYFLEEGNELLSSSLLDFFNLIETVNFVRLKRCKKDVDIENQEKVKNIRDEYKKILSKLSKEFIGINNEKIIEQSNAMYNRIKKLVSLVINFNEIYSKKKRGRNLLDFNDIEHFCLKILEDKDDLNKPSSIAEKLKDKFYEILIDEYQDSNLVQEKILNLVSKVDRNEPNIFMVGDVKQSIYRFRQAKPELFLDKYSRYSKDVNSSFVKVLLYKNFRSRKQVIDATNILFTSIMSKEIGELDYDENEMLIKGFPYEELEDENDKPLGKCEIDLVEKKQGNSVLDEYLDKGSLEAKLVAKTISNLIVQGYKVYDKEKNIFRTITYKDIVILLRSTVNLAPIIVNELKLKGIPCFSDSDSSYYESVEVKLVLSLLSIVDNPYNDIPLLAILRSPIYLFSTDELVKIRSINRELCFYEIMKIAKDEIEDENLKIKINQFLNGLNLLREKSSYMNLDEFIWFCITQTGYYGYVGTLPQGEQRRANLRILFERASSFEKTSLKGLFNFINYIEKLKLSNVDTGSAKILGENDDVVRIMSIHKSKGLEFPVVILSGTSNKFNQRDISNNILFHYNLGLGPSVVDLEKRISYPSIQKKAIAKKIKLESLSEEMRILYVAFTRAREKLIITGTVEDNEESINKWKNKSYDSILNSKNYLDWIMTCALKNNDKFEINSYQRQEIVNFVEENIQSDSFDEKNEIDEELKKEVKRRLFYKYPFESSTKIAAKISVTELKRMFEDKDEESSLMYSSSIIEKPAFLSGDKKISSAEKGIALHSVMQYLDINEKLDQENIEKQLNKMVELDLLTKEQKNIVDKTKIIKFFDSSLGKRMKKSKNVFREKKFQIAIYANEIYDELDKDEKIIVQGAIDCYFEEDNKLILIDYKTDFSRLDQIEEIANRYKTQIHYYEKALNRISDLKVFEKYIYLFSLDKEIKID
ncbi:MAG: helicase-exonuclease AddAB subunit AddA [Clostridiaceae bacterium]